ncbi:MAG: type II secretion system protein [Planctomycetota bacterium]
MRDHRHGDSGNGFTLVELLVVIAIISVLAALLLPALQEAHVQANIISCASNQRQALMGITLYSGDYNEFPVNVHPDDWGDLTYAQSAGNRGLSSPSTYGPWAPGHDGCEGSKAYWRHYLLSLGYSDVQILGCAMEISGGDEATPGGDNALDPAAGRREYPPYTYWGPGVDPMRCKAYVNGINARSENGGVTRQPRTISIARRYGPQPLLIDDFVQIKNVCRLSPHRRTPCNGPSEFQWYWREYDHNVGWSDGHVTYHYASFAPSGGYDLLDPFVWKVRIWW